MKKILLAILVVISAVVIPNNVQAKSYDFSGYYCDAKQPLDDGTFYLTCHIVAKTDFDINHIEGTLVLKNVKLESIKTSGDWVSNNGLSNNVSFTSKSDHNGQFTIADLVFTGNQKDEECEASFMPTLAEKTVTKEEIPACSIVDGEYYGKDASKVTQERYFEDCCNYVCTVVDNKYYFDSKGKSVSYDKFMEDCSTKQEVVTPVPESPQTGINFGYIFLPIGIISSIAILRFVKKNNKIYKI